MYSRSDAARQKFHSVKSRLGQALLRIQQSLEEGRREEAETKSRYALWRKSWLDRRERIAERLEYLETQLDRRAPPGGWSASPELAESAEQPPHLVVVGHPAEWNPAHARV